MTSVCDTARRQAANKMAGSSPDNANTPIAVLVVALCYQVVGINLSFCPLHQPTLCPIAQSVDFPQIPRRRMLVSGRRSRVPASVPIQEQRSVWRRPISLSGRGAYALPAFPSFGILRERLRFHAALLRVSFCGLNSDRFELRGRT